MLSGFASTADYSPCDDLARRLAVAVYRGATVALHGLAAVRRRGDQPGAVGRFRPTTAGSTLRIHPAAEMCRRKAGLIRQTPGNGLSSAVAGPQPSRTVHPAAQPAAGSLLLLGKAGQEVLGDHSFLRVEAGEDLQCLLCGLPCLGLLPGPPIQFGDPEQCAALVVAVADRLALGQGTLVFGSRLFELPEIAVGVRDTGAQVGH